MNPLHSAYSNVDSAGGTGPRVQMPQGQPLLPGRLDGWFSASRLGGAIGRHCLCSQSILFVHFAVLGLIAYQR